MALSSGDDFVILICTNPNPTAGFVPEDREITISTNDIHSWDLATILCYQTVKVHAYRNRLSEQSSYFHSLLSGSFSESSSNHISVQWNMEIFINILMCIYGWQLEITSNNFLPLIEGALYFGVERLLWKCRSWFSEETSSKNIKIELDDLIHIWNFGLEHANDFVPELCSSYLAKNFMWAVSNNHFRNIPYKLLLDSVKHPCLTVDSEMHLSDALLIWLDANTEQLDCSRRTGDDLMGLLKEIRMAILPLWFASGKRTSCCFSKFADESVNLILGLVKTAPSGLLDVLGDMDMKNLQIRLTDYSEKVNLSGCPQITSEILLLSVLLSSESMNSTEKKFIRQSLVNLELHEKNHWQIPQGLLPNLSYKAVKEVDISKCSKLHLDSAIECFSRLFPSLRKLKAAYLLRFKTINICKLVHKCPMLCELDLTVDLSPLISKQVSVVSSSPAVMPSIPNKSFNFLGNLAPSYHSELSLSNITKLTLEGRNDLRDSDLEFISTYFVSLSYLNIKGCISVTDVCISNLIQRSIKLHSIVACDTLFGMNSILALCSHLHKLDDSRTSHDGRKHGESLASKLQTLHIGCCKGVDEKSLVELMSQTKILKSLCLQSTHLVDNALHNFSGSSLEMLDVSNTKISGPALAHLVRRNSDLKYLNARGCKNLFQHQINTGVGLPSSYSCENLFTELGTACKLEDLALGWGFCHLSFRALKPAIMSLRSITVGLGGSLGEDALMSLPTTSPMLESVSLCFQVISDLIIRGIMSSLRQLKALALCYCFGDISISSFKYSLPSLRKLRLERVAPWMTNDDLLTLTQNFASLLELSLIGCPLLNPDSQLIISQGWPGLISIHLEDCGSITRSGISFLLNCTALENLLLRHNGSGVQRNFILDAASKMPMLRKVSLDLCDVSDGDFEIPDYADRNYLSIVKIARCKTRRCTSNYYFADPPRQPIHKETLLLIWNSKNVIRTVVKERI